MTLVKQQPQSIDQNCFIDLYCVIRTYSAGVHIGYVKFIQDSHVILEDSRRLWRWEGAFTLSEVAVKGIDSDNSRMSIAVKDPILLTNAIEIIPVTCDAKKTMDKCHEK